MKKLSIETFGTSVVSSGMLGTYHSTLQLMFKITNNTGSVITSNGYSVSVKNNYLVFSTSTDIPLSNKTFTIPSNRHVQFEIDILSILSKYKDKKEFSIKVSVGNESFESEKISIGQFR